MRVAVLCGPPGSPLHNAFAAMVPAWSLQGVEVDFYTPPFKVAPLNSYDVVHMGWYGVPLNPSEILPPTTSNVWHVALDRITIAREVLNSYSQLIADSPTTISTLGQMGFHHNVHYAPMVLDTSHLRPLPPPSTFTCGFLGAEEEVRRWRVVREGAKEAGAACYLLLYRPTRDVQHIELEEDFFKHVSVYVHPGFIGTDPMTIHEAMAAGRPVIATRTSGPHDYIEEGVNGYFFDGSPRDLACKLKLVQANLAALSEGAAHTRFPSPTDVAPTYVEMWRRVVEEE